jgi:cholesterol oxidase
MQNLSRRKFIGLSAMSMAAASGSSVIGLSSCNKEHVTPGEVYTEALVIGSGFGGAVAALRLGEKGVQTIVLEMGRQWDVQPDKNVFSSQLNPDKRAWWLSTESKLPLDKLKFSWPGIHIGVLDQVEYPGMNIYRGNCVGGGSVVYGNMTVQPTREMFNRFMPGIPFDEMDNIYYPRVQAMIQAYTAPVDVQNSEYFRYNRVSKEHAERAGMTTMYIPSATDFNILRGEINGTAKKCYTRGDVIYGINNGGKNSLDRNYLPAALGTGHVQIHSQHRAKSIRARSNAQYEVLVERIDERGSVVETKSYACKYLFINAGVIGTMELLLSARENGTLPDLSPEVGKYWGYNGNVMMMRKNIREATGTLQANPPIMATLNIDNPVTPLLAEHTPFPLGIETHSLLSLAVTYNETFGEWKYDKVSGKTSLHYPESGKQQTIDAGSQYVKRLNDANGGDLDTFWFDGGFSSSFTYHPLGGAVLGKASDHFGRLKGYNNLYCLDGSMIPGNTVSNPSWTIAALAERAMDTILAEDFGG